MLIWFLLLLTLRRKAVASMCSLLMQFVCQYSSMLVVCSCSSMCYRCCLAGQCNVFCCGAMQCAVAPMRAFELIRVSSPVYDIHYAHASTGSAFAFKQSDCILAKAKSLLW